MLYERYSVVVGCPCGAGFLARCSFLRRFCQVVPGTAIPPDSEADLGNSVHVCVGQGMSNVLESSGLSKNSGASQHTGDIVGRVWNCWSGGVTGGLVLCLCIGLLRVGLGRGRAGWVGFR